MSAGSDPDLPGDARFIPAPSMLEASGLLVSVIAKPLEEQRAIHHNQLRYAELQKLRAGHPNRYEETRYR